MPNTGIKSPNKLLHWPPGGPSHASCIVMMFVLHKARQLSGASELKRCSSDIDRLEVNTHL